MRERYALKPHLFEGETHVEWLIHGMEPLGGSGIGPMGIAVHEQLVDEALFGVGKWQKMPYRVPTDVFTFSLGEPEKREVTKVGGIPYWSESREWLRTAEGKPMTFVAQFCFADSRDLPLPATLGDVLLVFADKKAYYFEVLDSRSLWENDSLALTFAWEQLGAEDLVTKEDIPKTGWNITPCYGAIHRAYDYPDGSYLFDFEDKYRSAKVVGGIKIGGVPSWLQDEEPLPGRHLCTLDSVWPSFHHPYPFLNMEEPANNQSYLKDLLSWGDAGSIYIFVDERSRIHWTFQST